jgi:hypothetical protein
MISTGHRPPSRMVPHRTIPSYSTVCHPSSRLTRTMLPSDRRWGWGGWTPLLCVEVWLCVMVESSSAKEEDGDFRHKKANEEVIYICLRDSSLYPLP